MLDDTNIIGLLISFSLSAYAFYKSKAYKNLQ